VPTGAEEEPGAPTDAFEAAAALRTGQARGAVLTPGVTATRRGSEQGAAVARGGVRLPGSQRWAIQSC
jgi:hypothetical protein